MSRDPTGLLRPQGSAPPSHAARDTREARAALAAGVLDARAFVEMAVPRTRGPVRGRMRLLTRSEVRQVRQESRLGLAALGLDEAARSPAPEAFREWHEELVPRTVAVAMRALEGDAPLASLEEWQLCDDAQIETLWNRYRDLEQAVDPLALPTLTDADLDAIRDAAKKKDAVALISYGSSALLSYVITSVAPPAT